MEYRILGHTGLPVSVLSYGAWVTFGTQMDLGLAKDCMQLAYDYGVNFFDNSEVYNFGNAEIIMGQIIKELNWDRDTYYCIKQGFLWKTRKSCSNTKRGTSQASS